MSKEAAPVWQLTHIYMAMSTNSLGRPAIQPGIVVQSNPGSHAGQGTMAGTQARDCGHRVDHTKALSQHVDRRATPEHPANMVV